MGLGSCAYLSEARGHVQEVYELLLRTGTEVRLSAKYKRRMHGPMPDDLQRELERRANVQDFNFERVIEIMTVIESYNFAELRAAWAPQTIDFLGSSPSARERMTFDDEEDRTLFMACALWHGRGACGYLLSQERSGDIRPRGSYRDKTVMAAQLSLRHRFDDKYPPDAFLPHDYNVEDNIHGSARKRYQRWSFDLDPPELSWAY